MNLAFPTSSRCGPTDIHVCQEKQEHMLKTEHFQQKPTSSMRTKANQEGFAVNEE